MSIPKIYADFNNADSRGRIRLNCVGTTRDMALQNLRLSAGLTLDLYSDDADDKGRSLELHATGVAEFSDVEQCWVAAVDWNKIRRVPVKPAAKAGHKSVHTTSKKRSRTTTS